MAAVSGGPRWSQAVPLHRALPGACGQSQVPSAPWGLVSWEPSSRGLGPNRASTRRCYRSGGRRKPPKEHGVWLVIFPGDKIRCTGRGGGTRGEADSSGTSAVSHLGVPQTSRAPLPSSGPCWRRGGTPGSCVCLHRSQELPAPRGQGGLTPLPSPVPLGPLAWEGAVAVGSGVIGPVWVHMRPVPQRGPGPSCPRPPPPPRPLGPSRTPPPARGPSPVPSSGVCRRRVCTPSRV